MSDHSDTRPLTPAPAHIDIRVRGEKQRIAYERAFILAAELIEHRQYANAAKLFEQLQRFTDRGARAFIMQAFCEAGALHFDNCSKPLTTAFDGERQSLAAELHNAFISYHVGIRNEAVDTLARLANANRELPTICLLLGDMLQATGKLEMARKCWSMAVKRDWPNGAVAMVAMSRLKTSVN